MEETKNMELQSLEILMSEAIAYCLEQNGYQGEVFLKFKNGAVLSEEDFEKYKGILEEFKKINFWIEVHELALENQETDIVIFERILKKTIQNTKMNPLAPHVIEDVFFYFLKPYTEEKNLELTLHIDKRFPWINDEARHFLFTAEQIYNCFKDNNKIDFAPMAVEYCKVVEATFWKSEFMQKHYGFHMRKTGPYEKTLGRISEIVRTVQGPLFDFRDALERIRLIRNNGAHLGVEKIPDVEWLRDIIWKSDLLDHIISGVNIL